MEEPGGSKLLGRSGGAKPPPPPENCFLFDFGFVQLVQFISLGDISEKLAPIKVGSAIFKRPKNREDGSDFDDFWTKSITATQAVF